jgi:hypothetical protein
MNEDERKHVESLRAIAYHAFWKLAWEWQSYMYEAPTTFDMTMFAPEAREMMNSVDQKLYDALAAFHPMPTPD